MDAERQRGAQPGNQNARIHGFYSKKLLDDQKQDFEQAALVEGVDEEIALLRVKIKSVVEHDPENVKLIEQAIKTLARLVMTRYNLHKDDKVSLEQTYENAIRNILYSTGTDMDTFMKLQLALNKDNLEQDNAALSP
jgi:hypothetical protein